MQKYYSERVLINIISPYESLVVPEAAGRDAVFEHFGHGEGALGGKVRVELFPGEHWVRGDFNTGGVGSGFPAAEADQAGGHDKGRRGRPRRGRRPQRPPPPRARHLSKELVFPLRHPPMVLPLSCPRLALL